MVDSNEKHFLIEHNVDCGICMDEQTSFRLINNNNNDNENIKNLNKNQINTGYKRIIDDHNINNGNGNYHLNNNQQIKVPIQQPYYLCTIACCESKNCINSTTSNSMNKFITNQHFYKPFPTSMSSNQPIHNHSTSNNNTPTRNVSPIFNDDIFNMANTNINNNINNNGNSNRSPSPSLIHNSLNINNHIKSDHNEHHDCEYCFREKQRNLKIFWSNNNYTKQTALDLIDNGNKTIDGSQTKDLNCDEIRYNEDLTTAINNSNKIKLKNYQSTSPNTQMININDNSQSPDICLMSVGNNSSNTDYTDIYTPTPVCTSANSNSIIQPLFKMNQNSIKSISPQLNQPSNLTNHQLDYRLYFINDAEKHGFFRKAVPTLPLPIAVMFCILNLILPGSGKSIH